MTEQLNPAPVGAAIGRPSVEIRSDVKQNASAEKSFTIITGRADAKAIRSIFNANWPCAEHRTSNARPYKLWFIAIFHLNSDNISKNSAGYFRAAAKKKT